MSCKQQYSAEVNLLKISLTQSDDKVSQARLKEAQLMMEKDLLGLKA